jgi:hypothetical protein
MIQKEAKKFKAEYERQSRNLAKLLSIWLKSKKTNPDRPLTDTIVELAKQLQALTQQAEVEMKKSRKYSKGWWILYDIDLTFCNVLYREIRSEDDCRKLSELIEPYAEAATSHLNPRTAEDPRAVSEEIESHVLQWLKWEAEKSSDGDYRCPK